MRDHDVRPKAPRKKIQLKTQSMNTRMAPSATVNVLRGEGRSGALGVLSALAILAIGAETLDCASATTGSDPPARVTSLAGDAPRAASSTARGPTPPPEAQGGPWDRPPRAARAGRSIFRYPWVWTDEGGAAVGLSRWIGTPLVITGIYTTCKSTCPRTVAKLEKVYAEYLRAGRHAQFLLVTLDPENDKPADLLRYKRESHLPDAWHLLAGSERDTRELTDVLDLHVMDDGPHVMHEGKIVVFDGQGHSVTRYGGWGLDEETVSP